MSVERPTPAVDTEALQVYLLGTLDFEAALALQKHLVYQVAGDRRRSILLLCEHPPLITVGREGSRSHVAFDPDELRGRSYRVRWVNRGGGCLVHLPGQLAIYPIIALDRLGFGLQEYIAALQDVLVQVVGEFSIVATTQSDRPGVWVDGRRIAHVGVAVLDWVTYYGAALNVQPDLEPFRHVRCGPNEPPMTSIERERHGPLRIAMVRERFLEFFAARFGFARTSLFFHPPALVPLVSASSSVATRGQ